MVMTRHEHAGAKPLPGRAEAMRRLCEAEPALCVGHAAGAGRARRGGGATLARLISGSLILWLLLALGLSAAPAAARWQQPARTDAPAAERARSVVERVGPVGMTVSDMDRSIEFYSKVLSFEVVSDAEVAGEDYERLQGLFGLRMRVVVMRLGSEEIELTEYLAPEGRPAPPDSRSNDLWFQHVAIITGDMERAYAWLRQNKVRHASTGPQTLPDWNRNAGGIRAFYFKDPDGHALEILQFPPDKGAAKWRELAQGSDRLFLGIDHTAIVVSDTEASLKFYRDALGLSVAGESENYGAEQERLNNVFGARLRITSLRAPGGGPGVEFLEYLAPRGGRARPADARPNDLLHWQTTLFTRDAARAATTLRAAKHAFVSPGLVSLAGAALGLKRGFLVRDPDGHVMKMAEKP
jgi:catechol 2,3-dioxygenase-like lactoylglutathione lyase family enzyme